MELNLDIIINLSNELRRSFIDFDYVDHLLNQIESSPDKQSLINVIMNNNDNDTLLSIAFQKYEISKDSEKDQLHKIICRMITIGALFSVENINVWNSIEISIPRDFIDLALQIGEPKNVFMIQLNEHIKNNDMHSLRHLLNKTDKSLINIDLAYIPYYGSSPLIGAIEKNNYEMVELLLEYDATPSEIYEKKIRDDKIFPDGYLIVEPISVAVENLNIEIINLLLSTGIGMSDYEDLDERTIVQYKLPIIEAIKIYKKNKDIFKLILDCYQHNLRNITYLKYAVEFCDLTGFLQVCEKYDQTEILWNICLNKAYMKNKYDIMKHIINNNLASLFNSIIYKIRPIDTKEPLDSDFFQLYFMNDLENINIDIFHFDHRFYDLHILPMILEIFKHLGYNINTKFLNGYTLLEIAIHFEKYEAITYLIERGASLRLNTVLLSIKQYRKDEINLENFEIFKYVFTNATDLSPKDMSKILFTLCERGGTLELKYLLDNGVDLKLLLSSNFNEYQYDFKNVIQLLMEYAKESLSYDERRILFSKLLYDVTDVETFKSILNDIGVDSITNKLIQNLVSNNKLEHMKYLSEINFFVDHMNIFDFNLFDKALKKYPDMFKILIHNGANPNQTDIYGYSILMDIIRNDDIELLTMLCTHGANVNHFYEKENEENEEKQNKYTTSVLSIAAKYNTKCIPILLLLGANPNIGSVSVSSMEGTTIMSNWEYIKDRYNGDRIFLQYLRQKYIKSYIQGCRFRSEATAELFSSSGVPVVTDLIDYITDFSLGDNTYILCSEKVVQSFFPL